ncbi:protein kinase family protein [Endozoicomonas euniceicola]|uniref:Protein kinase family protein n=1 Tax=Endozoicomonas euniceicola TaxID=1234143 RepID=A0ABY6GTQ8_9GAMM|nr:protein kinase family protein [Endozoicomonas euniceicola]UYM16139.1 protein kinase family protein [Endozoicomonas euniceicola]
MIKKWLSCCLNGLVLSGVFFLLLSPDGHAGYLGKEENDPEQLLCILPVNGGINKVSVTLFFSAPFYIVSSVNLLSGRSGDGYSVSRPGTGQAGSYIRIMFPEIPVPVCLAIIGLRGDREGSLKFNAANSYFRAGDAVVRLTENSGLYSFKEGAPGLGLLHASNTARPAATSYLFARPSGSSRPVLYSLASQSMIEHMSEYLDGLSLPRQILLAELNARYTGHVSGVGELLFRYLWFSEGISHEVMKSLMLLLGSSRRLQNVAISEDPMNVLRSVLHDNNMGISSSRRLRVSIWNELLPHLGQVSQQGANQLLSLLSSSTLEDAVRGIQECESSQTEDQDEEILIHLERYFASQWDYQDPVSGRKYRYSSRSLLGEGGEGKVFHVIDDQNHEWALKTLDILGGGSFYQKTPARLEAALKKNKLNSSYIVKPERSWTDGRTLFEVFELYPDGDLDHVLNQRFGDVQENLQDIISQVVFSVAVLHANGVVHRDIKPGNFLMKNERVSLSDLGFVREINNPDEMVMSMLGTPALFGGHTSDAFLRFGNYSPLIMDYETLAMTLFTLCTGHYFLDGMMSPATQLNDQVGYRRAIFNALSLGEGHPPYLIKSRLKKLWEESYITTKRKVMDIPEPVLTFISELLAITPSQPKDFFTLINMMREHDYFAPFLAADPEAQALIRSFKIKNDQDYTAIRQQFRADMEVHWVAPDGNCLPAAIAEAINHAIPDRQENQFSIRRMLVGLFRSLTDFIQQVLSHPDRFELSAVEATNLHDVLRIELASLTGIDVGQMDNLPDDGSTDQSGWLEPSLLVLLPLIGVNVNLYAPHHGEGLAAPMLTYNQQSWDAAPLLSFYLREPLGRELIPQPAETHTITLIQNGAHGASSGAGHYYYATESAGADRVAQGNCPRNNCSRDEVCRSEAY